MLAGSGFLARASSELPNGLSNTRSHQLSIVSAAVSATLTGVAGTVIVVDNVVRHARILDPAPDDAQARGMRDTLEMMGAHPRLDLAAIQTVGVKGWDGFAIAVLR